MNPEAEIIQLDKPDWGVIGGVSARSTNSKQAMEMPSICVACLRQPMAAMWVGRLSHVLELAVH